MAEMPATPVGSIAWTDLTVPNATEVRDFYARVVGWKSTDHAMGDYADYNILRPDGECVAGICHARGSNANVPPQWLIYVIVESVEASAAACREHGGEVLDGPRPMGGKAFCVIKDPAGAVMALMEG
jgi:predicted enzyme related to lactoylglutathione lyase